MIISNSIPRQPFGSFTRQGQRGAVLVVALIFLILLTILALSASGRSLLQERMAGGLRNAQQATMSANTALRAAEWEIWSRTSVVGGRMDCPDGSISASDGCTKYDPANALYGPNGAVTRFLNSQGWVSGVGHTYTGPSGAGYTSSSLATAQLARNPVYLIEDMGLEVAPGVSGPQHESGVTGGQGSSLSYSQNIYRITARATGGNANTVRVLQTTFAALPQN